MGKVIGVFLGLALAAAAQGVHSATLSWIDTQNPVITNYSIYRATGICSGSPSFSKIATAIAVKTYIDSTVQPGNYCYYVTASYAGVESAASNTAAAPVPSFTPTSLTVTIQ